MPYKSPYPEFEFTELVSEATKQLGIDWNSACKLMDGFRVDAPEWDVRYYDFGIDEITEEDYDERAVRIMKKIFEDNKTDTIRVLK